MEDIIEESLKRRCFDNVTGIIIALHNNLQFDEKRLVQRSIEEIEYEDA